MQSREAGFSLEPQSHTDSRCNRRHPSSFFTRKKREANSRDFSFILGRNGKKSPIGSPGGNKLLSSSLFLYCVQSVNTMLSGQNQITGKILTGFRLIFMLHFLFDSAVCFITFSIISCLQTCIPNRLLYYNSINPLLKSDSHIRYRPENKI